MPVPKSLALATALILELTTLADAASRTRQRSQPVPRAVPAQRGDGYSSSPRTRELEILADQYRPG
jgi:hypothetical protein